MITTVDGVRKRMTDSMFRTEGDMPFNLLSKILKNYELLS